jgi:predicted AlkP superfamily phosphohydrolase/phosphomutase
MGLSNVVINLPLSYPPFVLKGTMISDWLYPKHEVTPKEDESIVKEYVPVNPLWLTSNSEEYLEKMCEGLACRVRVMKRLFLEKQWSLFFTVFSEPDFLLHKFYDDILSGQGCTPQISQIFTVLDDFIGWILQNQSSSSLLFVVSDHGFTSYSQKLHVNMVLHKMGFVKPKTLPYFLLKHPRLHNLVRQVVYPFFGREMISRKYAAAFNIASSKALMHAYTHSGIYLNAQDVFTNGIISTNEIETYVQSISTVLRSQHNAQGDPIVQNVYPRESLFHGPHTKHFPHLVFFPQNGWWFDNKVGKEPIESTSHIGHSLGGLFLSNGETVRRGVQIDPITIYDILPTALHYLGLPVPHDTDGRVLREIFVEHSSLHAQPLKTQNYFEKWTVIRRTSKLKKVSCKNHDEYETVK